MTIDASKFVMTTINWQEADVDWQALNLEIVRWGNELGFAAVGISDTELGEHGTHLDRWLDRDYHGTMGYMSRHGSMRSHPEELHPDTQSIISVRIDYLEPEPGAAEVLAREATGYISRYALGRDYHKVLRGKLKKLSDRIGEFLDTRGVAGFNSRVFTDSAPILEKAVAEKAGLGWIGKNTLLLNVSAGSWFFLGEILTNLPLPPTGIKQPNRCGSCSACIEICPTHAIVGPYKLDARKCISYLTIEHRGSIPIELRSLMGNRVFGCDDCQIVCPWNRYATPNSEEDFKPRHGLEDAELLSLFTWSEDQFFKRTEGSAIRRTGYEGWLRNLAIALGNAPYDASIVKMLNARLGESSEMVDEHIAWALSEQQTKARAANQTEKSSSNGIAQTE